MCNLHVTFIHKHPETTKGKLQNDRIREEKNNTACTILHFPMQKSSTWLKSSLERQGNIGNLHPKHKKVVTSVCNDFFVIP